MNQSLEYRKSLLRGAGVTESLVTELEPIAGKEEIISFLQKNQDTPECYETADDFANVRQKRFQANLHIHTTNSDGLMTVKQELDMAADYANSLNQKRGRDEKFFISISDHNTTNGTIEAIYYILENSKKYKNLKVALGVEASAMFTSPNTGFTQEVHLLSLGLNPFEDTIAQKNEQRLRIFQNNISQALRYANEQCRELTSGYNMDFNFNDFAKIRPSIKTCPSNVRYSLKDYLQFRVLFAQMVEHNPDIRQILSYQNIKKEELDFSEPKRRILNSEYKPYWKNYVKQTAIYLSEKIAGKKDEVLEMCLSSLLEKSVAQIANEMDKFEYLALNPQSASYIQEPSPLEFSDVLESFSSSKYAVSGIAHGALYAQNRSDRKLFLQDLYREFKHQMGDVPVFAEKYYPYAPHIDTYTVEGMIKLHKYIPSGGLDSHKNNIFTPQQSLSTELINELIGKPEILQSINKFNQNIRD